MPNALGNVMSGPPEGQADSAYWKWNPYTQQFEPTQAYFDLQQNGDPSLGTNVQYGLSGPTGLGGPSEHFDPGQNPTLFLNAGSNYADTGGMKAAVPGTDLYNQLSADERTRNQQGILRVAALVGGGALAANSAWSNALPSTSGYGTGLATATDAAYGSTAGSIGGTGGTLGGLGGGGGSALNAGLANAVGQGTAGLTATGLGGGVAGGIAGGVGAGTAAAGAGSASGAAGMGLGISDWLNIGNTVLGAYGANRAADIQSGASDAAIAEQRRQFDINQANQAPYQAAGVGALGNLTNPAASFQASPGYDFRRSEGQRDIGNSFAARGGAFSGNALKALTDYNQNSASNEYGNWWNQQAGLAGVGQTANNQVGAYGMNYANNVGNALTQGADARASGVAGAYGAINNGLTNYLYGAGYGGYGQPYNRNRYGG